MTYMDSSGKTFVLAHHSLEEWASSTHNTLKKLGCSEAYASAMSLRISQAKAV